MKWKAMNAFAVLFALISPCCGSLLDAVLLRFVPRTQQSNSSLSHVAPSWFRFVPIPSTKARYFIPGPFQPPDTETPFARKVTETAKDFRKGWEPFSSRFLNNFVYPLANATISVNSNKTEAIKNAFSEIQRDHSFQQLRLFKSTQTEVL